jgi:hypothetical protein
MNDTVSEDVKLDDGKLREILAGCEGVTPGPWRHHVPDKGYCTDYVLSDAPEVAPDQEHRFRNLVAETDIQHAPAGEPQRFTQNAQHIARLDPATVASIVTELLEARAYLAATKPAHLTRLREAISNLMDATRAECRDGPHAPVEEAQAAVEAAMGELSALITSLREALEPFAKLADDYLADTVNFDDNTIMAGRLTRRGEEGTPARVTFADFRRARTALNPSRKETGI